MLSIPSTQRMEQSDTTDPSVYFPINGKLYKLSLEVKGATVQLYRFYDVAKHWLKYFGTVTTFEVTWQINIPLNFLTPHLL